jgi:CheY-like chemotaxis protein
MASVEDPPAVFVLVPDLFFRSKIAATGAAAAATPLILETPELLERELPREAHSLVIIDLSAKSFDPMELAAKLRLRAGPHRATLIGFYPHVDQLLRQRAVQAGYDYVLPRSVFSRHLSRILAGDLSALPTIENH